MILQKRRNRVKEENDIHIIHSYPQTERPSTTISVDSFEQNEKNTL